MKRILFLISAFTLTACSSVPDFRPSKPVEEASSIEQAIDICGEYEIKGDQNASGRAEPARVITLVPWIRCFETVFRKYPESRTFDSFVAFFRALQAKHDSAQGTDEAIIDWLVMNYAVDASLRHMKNKRLPFSVPERKAIETQLPSYSMFLAETGRFGGRPARSQFTTQDLADMRREADAGLVPGEGEKVGARPMPLNDEQREYCKKYKQLKSTAHNAQELAEYKRVLESQTYADVSNANERAMQNRINERYEKTKKEAADLRAELDKQLPQIQAKATWFKNGHCLQSQGQLRKSQ